MSYNLSGMLHQKNSMKQDCINWGVEGRTIRDSFCDDVHDIDSRLEVSKGGRTRRNWSWHHVQQRAVFPFVIIITKQGNTRGRPTKMTLHHPHIARVIVECRKEAFQSLCLRCKTTEKAYFESTSTDLCKAAMVNSLHINGASTNSITV